STRSSSTTEKGAPPCAACMHRSCASLPERVVRAESPTSAAMEESSREALCSSSTMRMVCGNSAHLEIVGKDGAHGTGLAEKMEGPPGAGGARQRGEGAGGSGELFQVGRRIDLVVQIGRRVVGQPGGGLR